MSPSTVQGRVVLIAGLLLVLIGAWVWMRRPSEHEQSVVLAAENLRAGGPGDAVLGQDGEAAVHERPIPQRKGLAFPPDFQDASFYVESPRFNRQRRIASAEERQELSVLITARQQHLADQKDRTRGLAQEWTEYLLAQGTYTLEVPTDKVASERGTIISVADYADGLKRVVRIREGECARLDEAVAGLWTEYEGGIKEITDRIDNPEGRH